MRRDTARVTMLSAAVSLGLGAGAMESARAQDALGSGRALDGNLQVGSGGRNAAARDFRTELEFRNALVTGNVPGGRAFRGEVGYSAANDFRGALGSDDLFRFQLDSFYSGLATRNLTGLDTLQSSIAYSVAGQSDAFFGGRLIVNRGQSAVSAGEVTREADGPIRTDVYGNLVGAMRSPSQQTLRRAERAELVAYSQREDASDEPLVVSASSLLGVKVLPMTSIVVDASKRVTDERPLPAPGLGAGAPDAEDDAAQERDRPGASRAISPHQRILNALDRGPQRVEMTHQARPVEPERAEDQARPGDAEEDDEQPTELDRLREILERARAAEALGRRFPGVEAPEGEDDGLGVPGIDDLDETDGGEDEQTEEREEDVGALARRLLGVEIPKVDTLMSDETSEEVYARHMRRGEELLGEGRWFYAEERFTSALAIIPGDPMAAAGRVHAQLGAGMFLSAALNLRNLFRAYPEFIPVRFDEELLPRADRLELLKRQLRQRAERDTPVGRDAAFLLAYLGHQFGDEALTREALAMLDRIETSLGLGTDPLHEAVHAVWLEGKE